MRACVCLAVLAFLALCSVSGQAVTQWLAGECNAAKDGEATVFEGCFEPHLVGKAGFKPGTKLRLGVEVAEIVLKSKEKTAEEGVSWKRWRLGDFSSRPLAGYLWSAATLVEKK